MNVIEIIKTLIERNLRFAVAVSRANEKNFLKPVQIGGFVLSKLCLFLMFLLSTVVFNLTVSAQRAELIVQTGHSDAILKIAFSPDGRYIASLSDDQKIKLWEVISGKEVRSFDGLSGRGYSIAFSPDGRKLISSSSQGIKMWDINTGAEIPTLPDYTQQIVFSPDGKQIAVTRQYNSIKLRDALTGKEIKTLLGDRAFESFAFSPDGKKIVSGGWGKIWVWDWKTGKEIRVIKEPPAASITSIEFSPDGSKIAVLSRNTVKLWDIEIGMQVRAFPGHFDWVSSITFSPDGKQLVITGTDKIIKLLNVETGEEIRILQGHSKPVLSVKFSPDGKLLASAGADQSIKLWNAETGEEIRTLERHSSPVLSATFSPNGRQIATAAVDQTVKLWNTHDAEREIRTLQSSSSRVESIAFSPDGRLMVSASTNNIKLWDPETDAELRTLTGHSDFVKTVTFSPDGKTIASGGWDSAIKLWDAETGENIRTIPEAHDGSVSSLVFSPDGQIIASASTDKTVKLWSATTGAEIKILQGHNFLVESVTFSPDGKIIASASRDKTIKFWDAITGSEISTLEGHSGEVWSVAFSPDGKQLVSAGEDKTIKLWDTITGKEIRTLQNYSDAVKSAAFSPDGRHIISVSWSTATKIWDAATGKELARLITLDANDWVVTTPEGLFDGSLNGRKLVHYVIGLEPISLEQMKNVYYVPGLLQKIFKSVPLPKVELFSRQDLFPRVEYNPLKPNQKQLTVRLTNRGGGIGRVQILFNDKELISDARPKNFNPNTSSVMLTVDLSKAAIKSGEENKIEVIAGNAAGSLSTRGLHSSEIVYLDAGKKQTAMPNVYAIIGGISDYTGDNLKLSFAAKDAEDFAGALELGATRLLGDKSRVHIRLLTSNGDKSNAKFNSTATKIPTATKADFQNAFNEFKNAAPDDVFIVYLAGHGVSLNLNQNSSRADGDTYLYLTQEATTTDKSVLSVEKTREAMAISSDELKDLMKQNKALKQVLILDTCAAGAVSKSLVGKRDLPGDQIRAIERLKDNTGFYVLMGAAADAVSYEASQYGQGILTYSLLQAMKGARLRENQFADVGMLFAYAQDTVPQMAKNIGGIQRPLIITPDTSNSFDIGKFTVEEQKQIVLPNPKPLLLSPKLLDKNRLNDGLRLTQLLKEQLREISFSGILRGVSAPLVFVDAEEMTDAIIPSGLYSIEGDTINLNLVLYRNDIQVGKEIRLSGKVNEKEQLIKQLVAEIIKTM